MPDDAVQQRGVLAAQRLVGEDVEHGHPLLVHPARGQPVALARRQQRGAVRDRARGLGVEGAGAASQPAPVDRPCGAAGCAVGCSAAAAAKAARKDEEAVRDMGLACVASELEG